MDKPLAKGKPLQLLESGELLGITRSNALIKLYNAFINGRILPLDPAEILVSDKVILIKIGSGKGGGNSTAGWNWADPIEIDYTAVYTKGMVVHINALDALVTTGIRDAANPTGPLVKSKPGLWVATQDVPASTIVSGHDVWNLPQVPYPTPDDIDDPANFWYWISDEASCY